MAPTKVNRGNPTQLLWLVGLPLVGLCLSLVFPWSSLEPQPTQTMEWVSQAPNPAEIPYPIASQTLPHLARQALEYYFSTGHVLALHAEIPAEWQQGAGLFVTLSQQGVPRGCWGSLDPMAPNLAEATIQAAIGAATRDWRYAPLQATELDQIAIQVSIIRAVYPVTSMDQVDPTQAGLFVRSGPQGAVLLPGEALTTDWQLATARRLAGISGPMDLFKVEAELLYEF